MSTSVIASPERLALRYHEVANRLGLSIRTLDRERSLGRFPQPDCRVGRSLLYKPETIQALLDGGWEPKTHGANSKKSKPRTLARLRS
jgi:predicted DNA-binding transcriptional regulator AlpA